MIRDPGDRRQKQMLGKLRQVFGRQKPLLKLFSTGNHHYVYDAGTNKILKCSESVHCLLAILMGKEWEKGVAAFIESSGKEPFLNAAEILINTISNQHICRLYQVEDFNLIPGADDLIALLRNKSHSIELELTEECNLRCQYCYYTNAGRNPQFRSHSCKKMSGEIALAAIDYLRKNSSQSPEVKIAFYGGEPLLNFKILRTCVEYAQKIFADKKVIFYLVSNGTVITPEIAGYLSNHQVSIRISIDGPEEIHDRYRKNTARGGSFQKTIQGLKNLRDAYGGQFQKKVDINSVYAPPYSLAEIQKRADLWKEFPWLPSEIPAQINYYSGPRIPDADHREQGTLVQWAFKEYMTGKKINKRPHPYSVSMMETMVCSIARRPVFQQPADKFHMNACCIPGEKSLFVTVSGDFKICEKMSSGAPSIGNVKEGIDFSALQEIYLNRYREWSLQRCRDCWAVRVCDSCFIDGFDENGFSDQFRLQRCQINLNTAMTKLSAFCQTLEYLPETLQHFKSLELK